MPTTASDPKIPRNEWPPPGPPRLVRLEFRLQTSARLPQSVLASTPVPPYEPCCCLPGMVASHRKARVAPTARRCPSARTSCGPRTLKSRNRSLAHSRENAGPTEPRQRAPPLRRGVLARRFLLQG